MSDPRKTIMPRIARVRGVSNEFLIAEAVIAENRNISEDDAVVLGLLDREQKGWRRRQALAELMGGLQLARAAGCSWPEVCRLARVAAIEVRSVELRRSRG